MEKKIKVSTALILTFLLIISNCGCGKKEIPEEPSTQTSRTAAAIETEAPKKTEPETTAPAEPEAAEEPEVTTGNIGVLAGTRTEGKSDKDLYYSIARVEVPQVELTEETALEFPRLAESLKAYSAKNGEKAGALMERLTENYEELAKARPEAAGELNLCDETTPYVLRADSRVLSILNYTYAYYGGAHPDHFYTGVNFDSVTGAQLELADVITDMDAFTKLVEEKLKAAYPDLVDYFYSTPQEAFSLAGTSDANFSWNLGYEELRLIFNPYCLGAYAMGEQTVTVSYAEAPELFAADYTAVPDTWFTPILEGLPMTVDVLGNGKPEAVRVEGTPFSEEEAAMDYSVVSGNRACRLTGYAYRAENYLLKKDGKYYVYAFETSDNDWVTLSAVDLMTMSRDEDRSINAFLPNIRTEWKETAEGYVTDFLKMQLTDPEHFRLDSRVNCLGTRSAFRYYFAGNGGAPEPETAYFTYDSTSVLKVKKAFEVQTVDEAGGVTGTAVLEPDTFLFFVRTDDKTYADMQEVSADKVEGEVTEWYESYGTKKNNAADWSLPVYRIRVDQGSWPHLVDGKEESEVLGGINYAG